MGTAAAVTTGSWRLGPSARKEWKANSSAAIRRRAAVGLADETNGGKDVIGTSQLRMVQQSLSRKISHF